MKAEDFEISPFQSSMRMVPSQLHLPEQEPAVPAAVWALILCRPFISEMIHLSVTR